MAAITSTGNAAVKAARKLAHRPERDRAGAFLVEGPQAVREAIPHLRTLFVDEEARHSDLVAQARAAGAEVLTVTARVLSSLADTRTPQGLVGVASLADRGLADVLADATLVVVLWEVGEPGNAGTIIRTADAAGADAVVLTAGSVDARNPKAVRASAGSLFHLPVIADVDGPAVLHACRSAGLQLLAADAAGAVSYTDVDLTRPTALLFGNEAHGLPPEAQSACDVVTTVPLHAGDRSGYGGAAESLNLAATVAVIAYEAVRQRGQRTVAAVSAAAAREPR